MRKTGTVLGKEIRNGVIFMGKYLNPGNAGFRSIRKSRYIDKPCKIQIQHIVPIQMCLIRRLCSNFHIPKKFPRITALIIIGTQHLCGKGFAEPSGAADAGEFLLCPQRMVDISD